MQNVTENHVNELAINTSNQPPPETFSSPPPATVVTTTTSNSTNKERENESQDNSMIGHKEIIYDVKNVTFNSTIDHNVEYKNGFIFERARTSYFNPHTMGMALEITFQFLQDAVKSLSSILTTVDYLCKQKANKQSYSFTYVKWARHPCHYPLPIFPSEKHMLADAMHKENKSRVMANIIWREGHLSTMQGESIPYKILKKLQSKCNFNESLLTSSTWFVYDLEPNFRISQPCPDMLRNKEVSQMCVLTSPNTLNSDRFCNSKIDIIWAWRETLKKGLEQIKQVINDKIRVKRELFTFLTIGILAIVAAVVSHIAYSEATSAKLISQSNSANIDNLIDNANFHADLINILHETDRKLWEKLTNLENEFQLMMRLQLLHDSAFDIYEKSKERLHKLVRLMETCQNSHSVSSMALTPTQKSHLQNLARKYNQRVLIDDGTCTLVKSKRNLFLNFKFPIAEEQNKVEVVKLTGIPLFQEGKVQYPVIQTRFMAIFFRSREFAPLSEAEFNKCSKFSICHAHSPIINAKGICGASNYLNPDNPYVLNSCDYIVADPQPFVQLFHYELERQNVFAGPEGMVLDVNCKYKKKAQMSSIVLNRKPILISKTGHCEFTADDVRVSTGITSFQSIANEQLDLKPKFGTHQEIQNDVTEMPEVPPKATYMNKIASGMVSLLPTPSYQTIIMLVCVVVTLTVLVCYLFNRPSAPLIPLPNAPPPQYNTQQPQPIEMRELIAPTPHLPIINPPLLMHSQNPLPIDPGTTFPSSSNTTPSTVRRSKLKE